MKLLIDKNTFLEKISLASSFSSQKISQTQVLKGVYFLAEKGKLKIYSTDLTKYFFTEIKINSQENISFLIEPQKVISFLSYLDPGQIEIETKENKLIIKKQKIKGEFPLMTVKDFPLPPKIKKEGQKIKAGTLITTLQQILFSSAKDTTRPVLSGVLFSTEGEEIVVVSTDGFRLSLKKIKKIIDIPPFILPADFLENLVHFLNKEEEIEFFYLEEEKVAVFKDKENHFYSRVIEGEFPPYEKVIPTEKETEVVVDKEEILKGVQVVSVFSREQANVVVFEIKENKILIRSKRKDNITEIDAKTKGKNQTVAFNFKFLLEFLKNIKSEKNIIIDVLRPEAPVVFYIEGKENYLHIIMPIRIQEE